MDHQLPVTYILAQADDPAPFTPDLQAPANPGQTGTTQDASPTGQTTPPNGGGGGDFTFLILMVGLLVVMMIFFSTSQRREKKKRQTMLDALKKGDRVQSVGGIIGSVVDIRDDEIVVKVDENTNTRLRFARSAIQAVINKEA